MEIHSSSLTSRPTKLGGLLPVKVSSVENNVAQGGAKAPPNRQIVEGARTPEEIEQALGQAGLAFSNEPLAVDALNKPVNTRIQQALHAYGDQRNQPKQNQRAELIIGIDFYV